MPPSPSSQHTTPEHTTNPTPPRRSRPRITDQIQIVRELWFLREQARVQAAERCFLAELERLLSGRLRQTEATTVYTHSPPPPLPPHMPLLRSTSVPAAPPAPPLSFLSPPARSLYDSPSTTRAPDTPARERPEMVVEEVELLRSRQRVTNLSPEFRALLEGNGPATDYRGLGRSRSFGQLSNQRAVSGALESEFRHQLEGLMARRDSRAGLRHIYHSDTTDTDGATPFEPMDDSFGTTTNGDVPPYAREMRDMREEISVLRNMISASFDLQLDIQRSIRQEVSAAMNNIATPSTMETSACTSDATHRKPASKEMTSQPVAAGLCTVCLEKNVDSLLYGCGHMCTCSLCGRQLVAGGQSCPICRAPVRDVVRAFVVTE